MVCAQKEISSEGKELMMEKWFLTMKKADFNAWSQKFGISPITARLIRNRNIEEENIEKFLNGTLADCHSPFLMADMQKAVGILCKKTEEKKSIRIIGDYDADGICSAYILKAGLSILSACVDTVIPHRIKDGYGLNEHLIEEAYADGIDTIVTCDNGISAVSQIERAKELGMTVIVTDHHEVPFEVTENDRIEILPCADAVVDPKQRNCRYPYKNICGAVVAYKLIQALFVQSHTRLSNIQTEALLDELLQYAALATVCDVMELLDENRIFVKEGLNRMRQAPAPGLLALFQVNGIEAKNATVYHLGFVIGPCLNATGRLDTAQRALELLESRKRAEAVNAAQELKELNDNRKLLTAEGVEKAVKLIEKEQLYEAKVLVLYLPDCHESIAGIIAGRIRDKYYRPVFILTDAQEEVKGSGRSIEGYDMYQAIHACREYLLKYGGHTMAAGFSMEKQKIGEFRKQLNENCRLPIEDMAEPVHIDIALPLAEADTRLAKELSLLEPFGTGNKKPLFARKNLRLRKVAKMGSQGEFLRLWVQDTDGTKREMAYFGDGAKLLRFLEERDGEGEIFRLFQGVGSCYLTCAYQISLQNFRGTEQVKYTLVRYC